MRHSRFRCNLQAEDVWIISCNLTKTRLIWPNMWVISSTSSGSKGFLMSNRCVWDNSLKHIKWVWSLRLCPYPFKCRPNALGRCLSKLRVSVTKAKSGCNRATVAKRPPSGSVMIEVYAIKSGTRTQLLVVDRSRTYKLLVIPFYKCSEVGPARVW